jgi:hypothetical protein
MLILKPAHAPLLTRLFSRMLMLKPAHAPLLTRLSNRMLTLKLRPAPLLTALFNPASPTWKPNPVLSLPTVTPLLSAETSALPTWFSAVT